MCCPAPHSLWKSFRRSRTLFRDRPETVRLHPGTGVHLIPEPCSRSSRNTVRNHPGIAFILSRNPQQLRIDQLSSCVLAPRGMVRCGSASLRKNPRFFTKLLPFLLSLRIVNHTRNTTLASAADIADTSAKRRTGLLKHDRLESGQGLWIVPCESVHTFFMRFAIDLVYLDKKKRVRKVRAMVKPWRLSACLTAFSILELPAGTIARTGTQPGDQLGFEMA